MSFQISRDLVASRHLGQQDEQHRAIFFFINFSVFFLSSSSVEEKKLLPDFPAA